MLTGIKPFTALNVSAVSTKPNFTFYQFCLLCEVTHQRPVQSWKNLFYNKSTNVYRAFVFFIHR